MQSLANDRLHLVSLIVTLVAAAIMCVGVLLPNWWILKKNMGETVQTFGLFDDIHCTDRVCFPMPDPDVVPGKKTTPEPTTPPVPTVAPTIVSEPADDNATTEVPNTTVVDASSAADASDDVNVTTEAAVTTAARVTVTLPTTKGTESPIEMAGSNAVWLLAGRGLGIFGLVLVSLTCLLQLIFLKMNYRLLQIASLAVLCAAALVSFICGFLFISKFSALTEMYVNERPPGALTYTPAAPGCMLICSLLCVVAGVFTAYAFRPPDSEKLFGGKRETVDSENIVPVSLVVKEDDDKEKFLS